MFNKARIKLTAWYLLILVTVMVFFSLTIHNMLIRQVTTFVSDNRLRIEKRFGPMQPVGNWDNEFVKDANHRIIATLVFINGFILIIAGGLSFFLAGKTLNPIKQMVEYQNRFITDSSHELRTPLTSLRSAIEVGLRDKNMNLNEARQLISENLEDVNKLQSLSDSLLKLSSHKYFNGSDKQNVDINEILKQAIKNTQKIANGKNIVLVNKFDKSVKITGNKNELIELFTILLDNSIKYSNNLGKVEIYGKLKGKYIGINVKDNGIGISKVEINHIFDRFYRSNRARSKNGTSGFGLGLSIAKKIIDNHKGTATVISRPDKETIFTVYLPR